MDIIIGLFAVVALAYWAFRFGKHVGSRKAFWAGRARRRQR